MATAAPSEYRAFFFFLSAGTLGPGGTATEAAERLEGRCGLFN